MIVPHLRFEKTISYKSNSSSRLNSDVRVLDVLVHPDTLILISVAGRHIRLTLACVRYDRDRTEGSLRGLCIGAV